MKYSENDFVKYQIDESTSSNDWFDRDYTYDTHENIELQLVNTLRKRKAQAHAKRKARKAQA